MTIESKIGLSPQMSHGVKDKSQPRGSQIDTIVLARHGKPALSRNVYLNWRDFRAWWQRYDEGGLAQDQKIKPKTAQLAKQADIVLSSTLRRAVETVELAAGRAPDRELAELIEAALPPPHLGPLKFKPKVWGTLARIVWFFGYCDGMEGVDEARIRAKRAAKILQEDAADGKLVFAAAHGWFNRMVGTQLCRQGWKRTENQGDLHWSYRRYERISHVSREMPEERAGKDETKI